MEMKQTKSFKVEDQNINIKQVLQKSRQNWGSDLRKMICVTGGPCAGKTTFLASATAELINYGIQVYNVPEVATILMKGGAFIASSAFTPMQAYEFQKILIRLQISLENAFIRIALNNSKDETGYDRNDPFLILCDRGLMDGSAYCRPSEWKSLLDELQINEHLIREERYDAIIHLVTAADGAADFYGVESNEARYESVQEAI